jgi:ribulose-phosphate 3-epimerase
VTDKLIAASILSADFSRIGEAVELAERAGADLIHVDIMDGHFVPNLTLGPRLVASIRKRTRLPIDVHLMVENPRAFVPLFHEAGADWISLHVEATVHLHKDVTMIRDLGRKAGVVLNPATPIHTLRDIIGDVDFILLMSVNPGWGGQSFIPSCLDKIRDLKAWLRKEKLEVPIEVDGGIKLDNLEDILRAGMDIVVAGSAIFEAPDPAEAIREMKRIAARVPGHKDG